MSRTHDYRTSTQDVLIQSVAGLEGSCVVTLDSRFQGLPDAAHGGTVLALFDAITARGASGGDRIVAGLYRRRVPLATPLTLTIDRAPVATHLRLSDTTTTLVEGSVSAVTPPDVASASGGPGRALRSHGRLQSRREGEAFSPEGSEPGDPRARPGPPLALAPPSDEMALPVSKTCFACGTDNTLGLRARLAIDDEWVSTGWMPHEAFRVDDALAPVAVTTLLDEVAFWLGAAASGEAGMTTDLRVRLHRPAAFGRITVAGTRSTVCAQAGDPRYWDTDVAAWDESGALLASAAITFVAVRGVARKLVAGLLAVNPPAVLRRVFPAYVP